MSIEHATEQVKAYWEQASCGTTITQQPKHSLAYFEEIEDFRYRVEPYIHSFAQFTRWHEKRILEVGVGAGTDFVQFVRAGAQATGVDLTEEAVENVRHRLHVYGLEAEEVRQCNAERLPFPDGAFDLVYSWGVIHHAENMEAVLAEIYRVARPGGTVKIMVYNLHSVHTAYMYLRHALLRGRLTKSPRWAIYNYQESFATKVYSRRDIERMLRPFPHQDLRFHYWNQLVRPGARLEGPRRLLHELAPHWTRWYLAFVFVKRP
jgi:ubiquinone/menaquinone biosynthesis C-methylase UbiE